MRGWILSALLAFSLGAFGQASPFNLNIFKTQSFTATGQTGTAIQLNGLVIPSTVGSSYASGTITVTGVALTTVSFKVMGSSDNGATFYLLPVYSVSSPTTAAATTVTATGPGQYQIPLAGMTHVQIVTTGTFTATSVSFILSASPNASISRNGSGGAIMALSSPHTTITLGGTINNTTMDINLAQANTWTNGMTIQNGLTADQIAISADGVGFTFLQGSQIYEDPTSGLFILDDNNGGINSDGGVLNLLANGVTMTSNDTDGTNAFNMLQLAGAGHSQAGFEAATNLSAAFFVANDEIGNMDSGNTYEAQLGAAAVTSSGAVIGAFVPKVGIGDVTTTIANTNIKLQGAVSSPVSVAYPALNPSAAIFYGDSNTAYQTGSTCFYQGTATCWPNRVAAYLNASVTNQAISGDQACDTASHAFNFDLPSIIGPQSFRSVMIGTNDANAKGPGAYEATFNSCDQAVLTHLATPSTSRVAASTGTTTGTCANDTTYAAVTGEACTAVSSTITLPLTTTGGPIYIWARYIDSNTGTWTYAIDGGSAVSISTAFAAPISTQNALTTAPGLIRVSGIAAGSHTIVFTQTGAGTMAIIGAGTPSNAMLATLPYVLDMTIINQSNGNLQSNVNAYRVDILANYTLLSGDGLKLFYTPTDQYVPMTTAAGDIENTLHVNPIGGSEIAQAVFYSSKLVPGLPSLITNTPRLVGANYTLLTSDTTVFQQGGFTLTYPSWTSALNGKTYILCNDVFSAALVTVAGGSGTGSGNSFTIPSGQCAQVTAVATNNWYITSPFIPNTVNSRTANYTLVFNDSIVFDTGGNTITYPTWGTALNGKVFTLCNDSSSGGGSLSVTGGGAFTGNGNSFAIPPGQCAQTIGVATNNWFILSGMPTQLSPNIQSTSYTILAGDQVVLDSGNTVTLIAMPSGKLLHIVNFSASAALTIAGAASGDANGSIPANSGVTLISSGGTGGGAWWRVDPAQVVSAALTTTAATSDVVTIVGSTTTGHCSLGATNVSAATNLATTYISTKAAGTVTVTHIATAGMTYDLLCTPY